MAAERWRFDAAQAHKDTGTRHMPGSDGWIREARNVLQESEIDFFAIDAWRYWKDFALATVLAYAAASIYLQSALFSWHQALALPIAALGLYRVASLIHEVAHLRQGEMRAYQIAWNLLVGIVTLSPSPFFTRHHRDHHTTRMYGTHVDPEYVSNFCPYVGLRGVCFFALEVCLLPIVVFLRFLLAPLTFLHPRLREWVLRRASSLTLNRRYERRLTMRDRRAILAVEIPCWIRATLIPSAVLLGWSHWTRIPLMYVLAVSVVGLNQFRLLADHHLGSDGDPLDLHDHLLDSCNFTQRDLLTSLFFPFAIRYHALHHLFPSLPYHNLAAAHYYLLKHVAADSPYRSLDRPGWWSVARHAFRDRPERRSVPSAA
jgi:fatty acid desaturase